MQVKVALLFVGLLALASGKPHLRTKTPKTVISTISQVLLAVNQAVATALDDATQAIAYLHENADAVKAKAEADAAALIATAKQAIVAEVTKIQAEVNADAGKIIQCALDQQDTLEAAVDDTTNAVIESVAANIYGLGDSLNPVIADLQAQNQALNAVESQLAACDGTEDATTCATNILAQVIDILTSIPDNIGASLNDALAAVSAAAAVVAADTDVAVEGLKQVGLQVLNDIGSCAAA